MKANKHNLRKMSRYLSVSAKHLSRMSGHSNISEEVKRFVKEIADKHNFQSTCKIEYEDSSGPCEGYNSKTIAVDITDGDKTLQLFVKEPLKVKSHVAKLIANEISFYGTIYPAYRQFLNERGAGDYFENVPKCYGVTGNLVALENLKPGGFRLVRDQGVMDEDHIELTMKTLAKFHAISFALKDQKKETYDALVQKIEVCLGDVFRIGGFDKLIAVNNERFLRTLDPVEDKSLLDASAQLTELLRDALLNVDDYVTEHSAIIHGDCWCNNIMYSYDQDNPKTPAGIMIVDWQVLRHGSPALELSYFFYGASCDSTIEKLDTFLKMYHDELSKNIRLLGSDVDRLYPYTVLKEEWKKFAKYAFAMAFVIIRGLLLEAEEAVNLEDYDESFKKIVNSKEDDVNSVAGIKNEKLFFARMKNILKHFVRHQLL